MRFLNIVFASVFQRENCIVESCGSHRVVAFVVHWGLKYRYTNEVNPFYPGRNDFVTLGTVRGITFLKEKP
ncbi:hypothetical protein LINPERPRIM_LOCUS17293 [Linum perenne]